MQQQDCFEPLSLTLLTLNEQHHFDYKETDVLLPHEKIIIPMLSCAKEAWVYKGTVEPHEMGLYGWVEPLNLSQYPFLHPVRGKYKFNLEENCVLSYEKLWNSCCWQRGSIVIVLPANFDWTNILPECYRPTHCSTPNMGNSLAAIKLCKKEMEKGNIAIIFSASNGIEWCHVYAPEMILEKIYQQAKSLCQELNYN